MGNRSRTRKPSHAEHFQLEQIRQRDRHALRMRVIETFKPLATLIGLAAVGAFIWLIIREIAGKQTDFSVSVSVVGTLTFVGGAFAITALSYKLSVQGKELKRVRARELKLEQQILQLGGQPVEEKR